MANTPPPITVGAGAAAANLNELLFETLDDVNFVSGLTPVAGELSGAPAAAVAAAHRDVVLPPPALDDGEHLVQEQQQQQEQRLHRSASRGEQRSGSTSTRGNSGVSS